MVKETPTSETVDFALVQRLGIDRVAKALGIGKPAVQRWRKRGVPKERHPAILELADTGDGTDACSSPDLDGFTAAIDDVGQNHRSVAKSSDEDSPKIWIASMRDKITGGDDPPAPDDPPAWEDDEEESDQPPAADAPSPSKPADRQAPSATSAPQDRRSGSRSRGAGSAVHPAVVPPALAEEARKSVRLNRKTVLTVSGGLAAAIAIGLAHGMSQIGSSAASVQAEADDEPVFQPLGTAFLPEFTYDDLPGQQEAALTVIKEPARDPEPEPEPRVVTETRVVTPARDQNAEEEEAALQSPLFPGGASGSRLAAPASATGPSSAEATLAALDQLRGSLPTPQDLTPQGYGQPSPGGSQQDSFLDAQLDERVYLKNGLQKPLSDFEVKAGTIIPAALITGLNSDLPGEIIGQVTEHVYDTSSGRHLLIPQGAKIFGRYNAEVGYGQERAQIVWDRLIMPNGNSVQLEAMVGTDKAGYAGLADQVDHHLGRLIGAVILSSVISVGANLATDSGDDVTDALGDAAAQQAAQVGGRIVDRQLNVQPTITVRPGFKLNILVGRDMILEPYPAG